MINDNITVTKDYNLDKLINEEKKLVLEAGEKYGDYYYNCLNFIVLMQNFITEAEETAWIFNLFFSQIKKHIVLSFLSVLRRHHIQAMLDLRQVLEAGAKGAYAIAFQLDEDKFIKIDENGTAFEPEELKKMYNWLEQNYPESARSLKELKSTINKSCAHANIINAFQNFKVDEEEKNFEFSFFDEDDIDLVKVDLFFIGNIAKGLMDLFYGVNQKQNQNLITFSLDFRKQLKQYEAIETKLKSEIISKERFAKFLTAK